ncbi:hypothetical protein [Actinomadura rugatobispora]|uniref:Uncharacterized protein n=1 Tax=Actinomadura rugatobispora TaxID=1994 RepID=A0ABW1A181_9ACTN|nr:hypothetical protein GCM10010200_044840 [Actinomadura rugatobispora]
MNNHRRRNRRLTTIVTLSALGLLGALVAPQGTLAAPPSSSTDTLQQGLDSLVHKNGSPPRSPR